MEVGVLGFIIAGLVVGFIVGLTGAALMLGARLKVIYGRFGAHP